MIERFADAQTLELQAEKILTPCGDGKLVWRVWGAATATPLILLHGGSGSWNHWVRNIEVLAQSGHRVIVPDIPGFGDSATPPDGHDANVLPGWLERGAAMLLGDQAVDIVGFSYGGLTAGLWAHECPQRFRSLVLVGAPSLTHNPLPVLDVWPFHTTPEGPQRDAIHRHNLLTLMLAHEASADEFAIRLHATNVVRDRLRKRRLMLTDVLREKVAHYPCTVAGIYGEEDPLYQGRYESIEQALRSAPRFHSLTKIGNAGHWVQFENAPAFNAALLGLLQDGQRSSV